MSLATIQWLLFLLLITWAATEESDLEYVMRVGIIEAELGEGPFPVALEPGLPEEAIEAVRRIGREVVPREAWEDNHGTAPEGILHIIQVEFEGPRVEFDGSEAVFYAKLGETVGPRRCGRGTILKFGRDRRGNLFKKRLQGTRC